MKIDKVLDTPMGRVVFRGELSDDELDAVITMGLVTMLLNGNISPTIMTQDGTILSDEPDQLQWDIVHYLQQVCGHSFVLLVWRNTSGI